MFKPFVCLFFENVLNLSAEKTEYIVMDYKHYIAERLKIDGVSVKEIEEDLAVPPDSSMGDYALPCFKFAKVLRKSPVAIAEELKTIFPVGGEIQEVSAVNGYLNFKIDKQKLAQDVLERILNEGKITARATRERGKRFVSTIRRSISQSPFISGISLRPFWAAHSIAFSTFSDIRRSASTTSAITERSSASLFAHTSIGAIERKSKRAVSTRLTTCM